MVKVDTGETALHRFGNSGHAVRDTKRADGGCQSRTVA